MINNSSQSGSSSKRGIKTWNDSIVKSFRVSQSGSSSKRGIKTLRNVVYHFCQIRPRVGHPAKEGLRLLSLRSKRDFPKAQSGSSSKRGIKTIVLVMVGDLHTIPEWVIQQKRD